MTKNNINKGVYYHNAKRGVEFQGLVIIDHYFNTQNDGIQIRVVFEERHPEARRYLFKFDDDLAILGMPLLVISRNNPTKTQRWRLCGFCDMPL